MSVPLSPVSGSIGRSNTPRAWGAVILDNVGRDFQQIGSQAAWALALVLVSLVPIQDKRTDSAQTAYEHAHQLFLHGDLTGSEQEAEQGYRRFLGADPERAAKFQLLAARALIWRGLYEDSLRILAAGPSAFRSREARIESLTLEGIADTYLPRFSEADRKLKDARSLCEPAIYSACVDVPIVRGILALERGQLAEARQILLEGLSLARTQHDHRVETSALLNLGLTALQAERYDEAVDWSWSAYRMAVESGAKARAENALGNLGWAYFKLGDLDRGLELSLDAEHRAAELGDNRLHIKWLANAGVIYREMGDSTRAVEVYQRSLNLSKTLDSKRDIVNSLEDLIYLSIDAGKSEEASGYIHEVAPLVSADDHADELDVMLAQAEIAAARSQNKSAEAIFRTVEHDPGSPTSLRLESENHLAGLYELEGNIPAADGMYRATLTTFEAARSQLTKEDSQLPFLTNATRIYDDYIHFLVKQGKTEEALAVADQSRARTLAQGLGMDTATSSFKTAALHPVEIARKTGATVLFYWLGEKQSYLWAIGANGTRLFTLPAQAEITNAVERYRKVLLQPGHGLDSMNEDGLALYRMLVAPAADRINSNGNVVVVNDGPLSLLNFETLIVPGDKPHYWIEDANVVSAPSLHMLASAKPSRSAGGRLLLVGDAVSPNPDYPELPMAAREMTQIQKHFSVGNETVYSRQKATSNSYLASIPQQYSYIHFVAHGVASRTDPLDSAIILSRTSAEEDSFKLHAREIIQHPIDARLVTVSACYGGGTRSYAGEGLVGLSWAFLRAGAHNVIGALWEASDESTPALMDGLYQGLQEGRSPSAALRQSKLALLHAPGRFQQPFYWAPFQIYTGH
jgi:CHAT domain-containing protein/Tfp pilus assembly protein PilF